MKSNKVLQSIVAEKASSEEQKITSDLYCRTIQEYYEASKENRRALREDAKGTDRILQQFVKRLKAASEAAALKSGEATAAAMVSKAMKNAHRKPLEAKTIDEEKEEKANEGVKHNLPVRKKAYVNSVSPKYVSFLPNPSGKGMNVVDRGISLKGLRTILEEYRKNEESFKIVKARNKEIGDCIRCHGENLTHMLVKPETRQSDCYIELLWGVFHRRALDADTEQKVKFIKKELDETLGTVNVFVSHTWAYEFGTLIESIEQWEKNWESVNGTKHETFFYFVDYFAVNQHNQKGDLSKLQEVVRNSKVTCLVLSPWHKPVPLLRCWCIYEIAKTELYPSTRLNVAFPPKEIKDFKKNFFDVKKVRLLSRIIEGVDSEKADASYEPDKKMIKEEIESKLGGFQKVNELCIRNLRKWLIEQACEFADAEARGDYYNDSNEKAAYEKAYWVLKNVGTFLRQQGKFEKSVKYLNHARKIMEKLYGENLEEKEEEIRDSKKPYKFERSYSRIRAGLAQKIKDESERIKQKEYFLKLLNSLANALTDDKQPSEAETIYRKTLDWRRELLSKDHKDTKMTQFNLGVCLIHQSKYKEAEEILIENLSLWDANCKYHYWALFNLADLKSKTDRPEEADKDFTEACHGLREICNVKAKDRFLSLANVLWSKHLLRYVDKCKDDQEKTAVLDKALKMATYAYNNFRQNSDLTHPDTRLAARAKRRLELKLKPELIDQENALRYALIKNTYFRPWRGPIIDSGENITQNKIRVMHWNVLADKLAYPDFKKGGFGCSFEMLDWEKCRKDKVCAEIIKHEPDVVILVELDHYEDIRFILQEDFGYASVWKKKNKNFYTDGTGIFWKKERFRSSRIYKKPLAKKLGSQVEADQVFVAVELSPALTGGEDFTPFVVGGCHLKSTKKSKGENIRLDQCTQIMNILKEEFEDFPIILGADMNAEAKTSAYEALAYPFVLKNGLVSSYETVLKAEPDYTSWKFRIDEDNNLFRGNMNVVEWKYTIDFIFHSEDLQTLAVLDIPQECEIDNAYGDTMHQTEDEVAFARRRCLLPNARCPSDHLPIVADILLPATIQEDYEIRTNVFSL